jgi:secreted PhoX family phosphatase
MSDGVRCPSLHDGMAVVDEWPTPDDDDRHERFDGRYRSQHDRSGRSGRDYHGNDRWDDDDRPRSSRLVLIRNHEPADGTPYLNRPAITYANDGAGGTSNLLFDAKRGKWLEAWSSLAGTIRNCAGGVTPWGTWITCEETDFTGHGWNFEVGATKDCSIGGPTPLHDMGRFSHEALMVDPRTGFVYETEDSDDCGFYRFVPYSKGKLHRGGKLYMAKVKNRPNADLGGNVAVGTTFDIRWVRIDDPAATTQSCYEQGAAKGGARFRRLEGAWWGEGVGYFVSTDGGSVQEGQLFQYDPREETLTLVYDSPVATALDNPDNIVVTPRGGILFCEDAAAGSNEFPERLVGLTSEGEAFTFGINNVDLRGLQHGKQVPSNDYRSSEWAGACYSPDGRWLFVNIQTPGITFAITGPWGRGPL